MTQCKSAEESGSNEYCPPVIKGENDIPYVKTYNTFILWDPLLDEKRILIDFLNRMYGLRLSVKCCHQGAHYFKAGLLKMLYRWKNHQ